MHRPSVEPNLKLLARLAGTLLAILAMDRQIGRLHDFLKDCGLEQNTLWFFSSDNGPEGRAREARTQGSAPA